MNTSQDGILLVGREGHEELLDKLAEGSSESLLTRNYPVFMPTSYKNDIKLRLDSNILFYGVDYQLYDIFAVKGGAPITLKVGKWDDGNGVTLQGGPTGFYTGNESILYAV